MTFPLALTPPIPGAFTFRSYPGFGILGADIPPAGDSGGSPALNDDIDLLEEYYWRVEFPPSAGILTIFPDLTFSHTDAPDGTYTWGYRLLGSGGDYGTATVDDTFGNVGITLIVGANSQQANVCSPGWATQDDIHYIPVANSQQESQASAGSVAQGHLITIANSQQVNVASALGAVQPLPSGVWQVRTQAFTNNVWTVQLELVPEDLS